MTLRPEDCIPGTEVEFIFDAVGLCPLQRGAIYRVEHLFIGAGWTTFDGEARREPLVAIMLEGDRFIDPSTGLRVGYGIASFRLPPPERLDGLRDLLKPATLMRFHEDEERGAPRPREPGRPAPTIAPDPADPAATGINGRARRLFRGIVGSIRAKGNRS